MQYVTYSPPSTSLVLLGNFTQRGRVTSRHQNPMIRIQRFLLLGSTLREPFLCSKAHRGGGGPSKSWMISHVPSPASFKNSFTYCSSSSRVFARMMAKPEAGMTLEPATGPCSTVVLPLSCVTFMPVLRDMMPPAVTKIPAFV